MVINSKKVGIIFNSGAGKGDSFSALAYKLENIFDSYRIFCGSGSYGKNYIKKAVELDIPKNYGFTESVSYIVSMFIKHDVEMIVCVGGDGINAHVASVMIEKGIRIPIMGIAGGTQNIGPLIRFDDNNLDKFDFADIRTEKVGCLKVTIKNKLLGFAFCDVVLGDTYLGTFNNKICNLSAEAFLSQGKKQPQKPGQNVIDSDFSIAINDEEKKIKSKNIKQVIISPIYKPEFYIGKAVTGALCLAKYFQKGASILLADRVIIDTDFTSLTESMVLEQLLFGNDETCSISGFNGYVIIDGNVFGSGDKIEIEYIEDAVLSVTDACRTITPVGR